MFTSVGPVILIIPSDPAYPASRQTIYLQVAQPRGLVVLKGAGQINPTVRDFLSAELKIRVEVPALEILPDGTLNGGTGLEGQDVLAQHLPLADVDPNVTLGPDSIGTLSFTSGSTGIPKGVKGRHYSLTHFFPWMGQRFGLSKDSKFTMLSGIAHDPIQRDSESSTNVANLGRTQPFFFFFFLASIHSTFLWGSVTCAHR